MSHHRSPLRYTAVAAALLLAAGCDGTDTSTTGGGSPTTSTGSGAGGGTGGAGATGGGGAGGATGGAGGAGATGGAGGAMGGAGGAGGSGGGGGPACPEDDGNDCTEDSCERGSSVHTPLPGGTPCARGVCDGSSACVGCLADGDCPADKVCNEGAQLCVDPTCDDEENGGSETDVDCGGLECAPCGDGKKCLSGEDCESLVCGDDGNGGLVCLAVSCLDAVKNGDETDVDCGGSCPDCGVGQACLVADDCESGVCSAGLTCAAPACGDGVVNGTDGCDDGNLMSGDGCDANCTPTGCGNGILTGSETCDDGNAASGDGCDANCTASACGNGAVGGAELCDDGNLMNGDGCDANCTPTGCGNGILTGSETCDDGNAASGDGCALCAIESSYSCSGAPSVCVPDEIFCDDGVDNNGVFGADELDPSCQLPAYFPACAPGHQLEVYSNRNPGAIPDANPFGVTRNVTVAGGGLVARAALVFDIAHPWDGDVNVNLVRPNGTWIEVSSDNGGSADNYVGTVLSPGCAPIIQDGSPPYTGCFEPESVNKVKQLAGLPTQGTWGLKVSDDQPLYTGTLLGWKLALCATTCGDGTVIAPEICDDGNTVNGDGCDATCRPSGCGNGTVSAPEICDDGNFVNGDGCDNDCTQSACGNGVAGGVEECDDGNFVNGDGCDADCTLTGCGNGIVTAGEPCDDGNTVNADGCTNACTLPACGDGFLTPGEQCDDGDAASGDGCSSTCAVEPYYQCTRLTSPSVCQPQESACSDGADGDGDGLVDSADPDCNLPLYFTGCAMGQSLHVYRALDVINKVIPGPFQQPLETTIAATLGGTVQRAALLYTIVHPNTDEVDITLTPPGGAALDVCSDNGAAIGNFTNTLLDSACAASLTTGSGPFSGCYAPETPFTGLAGAPASGLWTLTTTDDTSSTSGTVNAMAMILCTTP